MEVNIKQCSEGVYDSDIHRSFQCQKRAVVERDGKPYCKIHDPEYVEAKRIARSAKWEKEWADKEAHWELRDTAVGACKEINPDNPQAVAESIKDMYEALEKISQLTPSNYHNTEQAKAIAREILAKARVT